MRRLFCFSVLQFALIALSSLASGQNGATTTLSANPATTAVGGTVGLTATVQPNVSISPGHTLTKPTGTITFLDGTTPLDSSPLALVPSTFASATFQQTFGAPDPSVSKSYTGELTGDLNGDGVADLLVYGEQVDANQLLVQAFISNGKGGYNATAVQTLSVSNFVVTPAVSNIPVLIDLNGDGKLDLLDGLVVSYGNGDGTFAAAAPVPFLSSGFISSSAADLNGDGKTDILAVNSSPVYPELQYSVTVFLNAGGGSFTSAGTYLIASGGLDEIFIYQPTFVDLNGDGKLDLILQYAQADAGPPEVSALLNNGDGTFRTPTQLNVPYPPTLLDSCTGYETGSGDVNGDGNQDVVLAICDVFGNASAITLLGNGDGTFKSPIFFALPAPPPTTVIPIVPNFVIQDVNLDGKLDLVFGGGYLGLGNGDGTFTAAAPLFPLTAAPYSYPLAQINLPGNQVPSLVYLLISVTPPPSAVFTPQTSSSAALSLATLAVGAHNISARYSGDANYPADDSQSATVTVNQAASATAATSSANPSIAGQSVTLTAHVTSAGPTPTGDVIFTSGSTALATVTLSNGSAAYATTALTAVGTQAITASYSGDANTQPSSATLNQVINAAFAVAPGSGGSTALMVQSGKSVSNPIDVTGAVGFSGHVTFACSGLPTGSSCSFNPATVTVSGTSAVTTSLSVDTAPTPTTSQLGQDGSPALDTVAYSVGFASLSLCWPIRRRGVRLCAMLVCLFSAAAMGLTGCGGSGGGGPKIPTGTYNFMVTATSGTLQVQSAYTLTVQ